MVFTEIVTGLWNSLINITNYNTIEGDTSEKESSSYTGEKTLTFPQGAQLLNLRENKNIRGVPYLSMSSPNIDKSAYIDNIKKKKSIISQVSESSMDKNLKNIEGFNTSECVDRDLEYYRNLNKITRAKQVAEQNRFYCLTGKDTHISEANTFLFKGIPYNQYTKSNDPKLAPWELQNIGVKMSPAVLCDVKLINEDDKNILENF